MFCHPDENFRWNQTAAGPALVCRPLEPIGRHFFTTRGWLLGRRNGQEPDHLEAWTEVAAALGVDVSHLARCRQVHGSSVAVANDALDGSSECDILITAGAALGAAVQAADCVPLLIGDPRTRTVAAAHAGWRGLARRVPARTVSALCTEYGSHPSDLVAAIGPSIGSCCYEVGPDVHHRFAESGCSPVEMARWFLQSAAPTERNRSMTSVRRDPRANHWFFDAWQAARDQLQTAGVPGDRVFVAALCTASHPELFSSYRRDGAACGRLAAAIRPEPPDPSQRSPAGRRGC